MAMHKPLEVRNQVFDSALIILPQIAHEVGNYHGTNIPVVKFVWVINLKLTGM